MLAEDWDVVKAIYLEGIATGQATFETTAPDWERWNSAHCIFARLVAVSENKVVGWAAITPVSSRPAYAGVAEVSVYVQLDHRGRGYGPALLEALINETEQNDVWTLQASVFPENYASVKLHRRFGFRQVGIRERIGKLDGVWRDTILLERRSKIVGIS